MRYKLLTNYEISDDKNIYSIFTINNIMVEIIISKSASSDNCFISIKENGEYIVQNKICTSNEYIMLEAKQFQQSSISGDFFFGYTTTGMGAYNFNYKYLGENLFLFYDDLEE